MSVEYVKDINEGNFDNIISNKLVLVDFSAAWCGPCRMMAPILEEVAQDMQNDLGIYKLDIDESQSVASKYQVTSIPTVVLFKDGKEVDRFVGLRDANTIKEMVTSVKS